MPGIGGDMSLDDLIRRLSTATQVPGAVSIPVKGETAAHTIPLVPGLSVATVPADRPVSPEERVHEGVHAWGGLPLAAAGTLGSYALGTTQGGSPHSYLSPDEVLAYMLQPKSETTTRDMKTIEDLARVEGMKTSNPFGEGYLALVRALARSRQ